MPHHSHRLYGSHGPGTDEGRDFDFSLRPWPQRKNLQIAVERLRANGIAVQPIYAGSSREVHSDLPASFGDHPGVQIGNKVGPAPPFSLRFDCSVSLTIKAATAIAAISASQRVRLRKCIPASRWVVAGEQKSLPHLARLPVLAGAEVEHFYTVPGMHDRLPESY